ncbi:ribosomal protein S5 domain 2-type protein [Cercophora newfieldiana]|uniref:Galactokinase n=1 Tax=Cercophora newfieldiana TaxID=92897 RepID=A0AA40CLL7_9PEZI|nr:ribosomal protein S5 domain 2-type protein [Cercophora newfieldiana]
MVPIAKTPPDIYHEDEARGELTRWTALLKEFKKVHGGHSPDFIARSPGRVNIIGEHIDYSLFPVLPMAIHADTLVAVRVPAWKEKKPKGEGEFTITIANFDSEKFPQETFTFPNDSDIPIDAATHAWTNYFKAGLRGAYEFLRKKSWKEFEPRDMEVLVYGTVPPAGGLSSSAAIVTASALAVLYAHGHTDVNKIDLTRMAIESERAVGVNSGGMDQAASVMSKMGSALYVEFAPSLSVSQVKFPDKYPRCVFMIAQSFVKADKKVSGPFHYNLRVVECTLAALVLLRFLYNKHFPEEPFPDPLGQDDSPLNLSLGTVFRKFWAQLSIQGKNLEDVPQGERVNEIARLEYFIDKVLPEAFPNQAYSKEEIAAIHGVDVAYLDDNYIKKRFSVTAEKFRLRDRAKHVFTETLRVHEFMELLKNGIDEKTTPDKLNLQLGDLMNQSQISCRDDFDCSTPDLDLICMHARNAGSYGSRLTGAGWGGATVHLVPETKVDAVRSILEDQYYKNLRVDNKALTAEQTRDAVIVSRPGSGSTVFPLDPRADYIGHWSTLARSTD